MKLNKYKKLKEEIENSNFEKNYNIIDKLLYNLSFLGNAASVVFAYFFVNTLLISATDDFWGKSIIVPFISIVGLSSFELLKRFLFKQTTMNILTSKKIKNEIIGTVILSLILISSSFYLSLNGAQHMADKSTKIDNKIDRVVNIKADSLTKIYNNRINKLENDKTTYLKIIGDGRKKTAVITQYNTLINKANQEIKQLEKEKEEKIALIEQKIKIKSKVEQNQVNSNVLSFLLISTFIELIILLGVWFDSYYTFRSYKEFDTKVNEEGNLKNYLLYENLLEVAYNSGKLKKGDNFDSLSKFKEIVKIKGLYITDKVLQDFNIVLKYLKISNTVGNKRIIQKSYDEAKEILSEYYNV